MDTENMMREVFGYHKNYLNNLDKENEKVLVLFSAVPGSGKSFISKKLEEKFKGIRFCNDDVRDIVRDYITPKIKSDQYNPQEVFVGYHHYFFDNLKTKNGFVILDSSIDRKLKMILEIAKKHNYKTFLIRIDLPKEILERNILLKIDKDPAPYLADLDRQIEEHGQVDLGGLVDFVIAEDRFNNFEGLYKEIEKKRVNLQ